MKQIQDCLKINYKTRSKVFLKTLLISKRFQLKRLIILIFLGQIFISTIYRYEIQNQKSHYNSKSILIHESNEVQYYCDSIIKTLPNIKPSSLANMLAGVKSAVILTKDLSQPQNSIIFSSLEKYLTVYMGFESVTFLDYKQYLTVIQKYDIVAISMGCELDEINLQYTDISLSFIHGMGYKWEEKATISAQIDLNDDERTKTNFIKALRTVYIGRKPVFDSNKTLHYGNEKTCWTENTLKDYFKTEGCDPIEGVYESSTSSNIGPKYKIAIKKIKEDYYIIYLSGGNINSIWKEGEVKARLYKTATSMFYKTTWKMADKSENSDYYCSFSPSYFDLIDDKKDKDIYIKIWPTSEDNIKSNTPNSISSGTGFAIASNGYIVTNYHVTKGAKTIKIKGVNGDFSKSYSAKIIIEDKNNDLSILKIDDIAFTTLGRVPYTISNKVLDVGNNVFVLGYPLRATMGDEVKLTNGIISAKTGFEGNISTYQISVPVQAGNSGGPLFDKNGVIIGIVNAKHLGTENVSYAIKSTYLNALISSIDNFKLTNTTNSLIGKSLIEQVKAVKKFIYIIEVN